MDFDVVRRVGADGMEGLRSKSTILGQDYGFSKSFRVASRHH